MNTFKPNEFGNNNIVIFTWQISDIGHTISIHNKHIAIK